VAENQEVDVAASCLLGQAAKAWAAIEHTKHQHVKSSALKRSLTR
jgi:hypothetical protein